MYISGKIEFSNRIFSENQQSSQLERKSPYSKCLLQKSGYIFERLERKLLDWGPWMHLKFPVNFMELYVDSL